MFDAPRGKYFTFTIRMRILKQLERPLLVDLFRHVFGVRVVIQQVLDFTGVTSSAT